MRSRGLYVLLPTKAERLTNGDPACRWRNGTNQEAYVQRVKAAVRGFRMRVSYCPKTQLVLWTGGALPAVRVLIPCWGRPTGCPLVVKVPYRQLPDSDG